MPRRRIGEPFITARDVAKMLGVSRKWVYQSAHDGTLPSYRFGGAIRFRRSEIEEWVRHHAHPAGEGPDESLSF
jgi:excisionase family DNA binding protein